jgi:cholesterol transport system auxiliary component
MTPACRSARRGRMVWQVLLLALLLAGCDLLPRVSEPVQLYTLTPKTTFDEQLPRVNWQLVVETPTAAAGVNTSRIVLSRSAFTVDYYANAAWTENAPLMVQNLLIESFEATRSIVGVGREAIGLRPDFYLRTDLREFGASYDKGEGSPLVVIRINAKLVEMPERRIFAATTVERRERAPGPGLENVLLAFDEALGSALKEIVAFTLREGERSRSLAMPTLAPGDEVGLPPATVLTPN